MDVDTAVALLHRACDLKQREACGDLAAIYDQGAGVPENPAKAAVYAEKACSMGQLWICGDLGLMLAKGRGLKADEARALTLLESSCGADYAPACQYLGVLLQRRGQPAQAAEAYRKACSEGIGEACNNLGVLSARGQYGNPQQSESFYQKSCEMGEAMGCRNWARVMFQRGDEAGGRAAAEKGCNLEDGLSCNQVGGAIERTGGNPLLWYERACGLNASQGCANAGRWLQMQSAPGSTNPEDLRGSARDYREKACELGDGASCGDFGAALLTENPKNQRALILLERGCDLKDAGSCRNLGLALWEGPLRQPNRAGQYFERGCALNDGNACNDWAVALLKSGDPKSPERARPYLERACSLNVGPACHNLALIAQHRQEAEEAKRLFERACWLGEIADCQSDQNPR